ncbi:MAG: aminoglycoside phosphotransferase family protein [Clostridiales bacterium]|jgi:hypothetical protein|nr:aminoglycoside phosphotransferase family protein [Clostridiales bacterium]
MYSNVARSDEYKRRLLEFVRCEYGMEAVGITPAKRGFYGETWRLDTADASYFLKLVYAAVHKDVYERSFPVVQHLCDHGIDFISRIVKARDGGLSTRFDGAVLGLFDWIDGENIETDATKFPEYQMLAKVYAVPSRGLFVPREDFSDKSAAAFFKQWNALGAGDLPQTETQLLFLLEKNRAKIEHRAGRLRRFADLCQAQGKDQVQDQNKGCAEGFFITHGDAGGNFIVSDDRHFIVDWDNPVLAPPERDAWVMCGHAWARDAFQNALRQNGIAYTLRPERLAYYCYHYFFFYLTSFLDGFTRGGAVQEIEEFFDGWIERSFEYADRI